MKTYIVDSFTNKAYSGNPAGVCIKDSNRDISELEMLNIAQELNLSETAFIQVIKDNKYKIRYFSPKMEIPLCGHATLASAKVIFEKTNLNQIEFLTIENISLLVHKHDDLISMEFPVYETHTVEYPDALKRALGIEVVLDARYNNETKILLLQIDSVSVLENLKPDYRALLKSHNTINGVLVTARDNSNKFDFHSRYFWPWSGTDEDPVTGGTHTFLTKYWSDILGVKKMKSYQSSKRTGHMFLELTAHNTVILMSEAVIILEGEWLV